MNVLLDAVGITKSFSGIRALDDVTLRVDEVAAAIDEATTQR